MGSEMCIRDSNKGGGINNQNDNVVIKNTLIYNNATQQDGGGLHSSGKLKLINSTLFGNTIPSGRNGSAMTIATGLDSLLLVNNVVSDAADGIYISNGKLVAHNNYFCAADSGLNIIRGSGNIFSDTDPFVDATNNNYTPVSYTHLTLPTILLV